MTLPAAIKTPCIRVCCVNPKTGLCEGCHRTLKEIATWGRLTTAERDAIMAALPDRQGSLPAPT